MTKPIKRVYVDSSVISGMFDNNDHPIKAQPFWDTVFDGRIRVVLSSVLVDELKGAPENVWGFFRSMGRTPRFVVLFLSFP